MGKIRRGGFVFLSWKGDHEPRHVHVFRDGRLVVKFDLEHEEVMAGRMTRRIRELIHELRGEGRL